MANEIRQMMPLDEAQAWVKKWRKRHFNKVLGRKDLALITLSHEVDRLNALIDQLSKPFKEARDGSR